MDVVKLKKRAAQKKGGVEKKEAVNVKSIKKTSVEFTGGVDENGKKNIIPIPTKEGSTSTIQYSPKWVEAHWYDWWNKQGFFQPDSEISNKFVDPALPPYTMVIPPPNITGRLHIGHALTIAIEDSLVRYQRMCGRKTLYVPGTDHAGIATQVVVEKELAKEIPGFNRNNYPRDFFIERATAWKNQYGGDIEGQLMTIGASLDWSRKVFTLDDTRRDAVIAAFVDMYDRNLISRSNRLVNWDCHLQTAISDVEIDYVDTKAEPNGQQLLSLLDPTDGKRKEYSFGWMTYFQYPVYEKTAEGFKPYLDEAGKPVMVDIATTRLETMLGDVAVAINSTNPATAHLNKPNLFAYHPFRDGLTEDSPYGEYVHYMPIVIDDDLVKVGLGTGCVKITPAHDPHDFACGEKHNLPVVNLLTDNGCMNQLCGQFTGQYRYEARINIEKELERLGYYKPASTAATEGKKPHAMNFGLSQRSKDVVEYMAKPQWYVDIKEMADAALMAVDIPQAMRKSDAAHPENKDTPTAVQDRLIAQYVAEHGAEPSYARKLTISPANHVNTWFNWLVQGRPWCVSRQLWWGHQIPAWRKAGDLSDRNWIVARTEEEAHAKARALFGEDVELVQDPDVLDTWFSSGLFPFSVFSWPEKNPDLETFYPTSVLETGSDILFFWVARMVMMGIDLTHQLPFTEVLLHSLVRDASGRKMSKSLGNVINPNDVIYGITNEEMKAQITSSTLPEYEKANATAGIDASYPNGIEECGTDALRFTLAHVSSGTDDVNLQLKDLYSSSGFCTKIWNAVLFLINPRKDGEGNLIESALSKLTPAESLDAILADPGLEPHHKWILAHLGQTAASVKEHMAEFRLKDATTAIRAWWKNLFCDVFLELCKPLETASQLTLQVIHACLDYGLRLLHPFMPFLSEEMWQRLPRLGADAKAGLPTIMLARYPDFTVSDADELLAEFERMLKIKTSVSGPAKKVLTVRLVGSIPQWSCEYIKALCRVKEGVSIVEAAAVADVADANKATVADVLVAVGYKEAAAQSDKAVKEEAVRKQNAQLKMLNKSVQRVTGSILCPEDLEGLDDALVTVLNAKIDAMVVAAEKKLETATAALASLEIKEGEEDAAFEKRKTAATTAVTKAQNNVAKEKMRRVPKADQPADTNPMDEKKKAMIEEKRQKTLASNFKNLTDNCTALNELDAVIGEGSWTSKVKI
ncbi:Valine-tRNA ligase [Carpediemonas membranifera]|uniref:valine--tRNA ligase n=1 Tax=Carpediemonas membranifera TaxID=201153 RepID=A0A8J6AWA6_9EUKA|nr:Valine-tRNA ligase [Carpediemonas membranifera]|eukprot:KAG9394100.1 Valine-tRNA ligase [Carpediemonas membranifera]